MSKKHKALSPSETAAIQKLIVDTQFRIHQLMEDVGVSRAELAKKLDCSKARVSHFFGDYPNITLETLARIFHALGDEPRVTSDRLKRIMRRLQHEVSEKGASSDSAWVISGWTVHAVSRNPVGRKQRFADIVNCVADASPGAVAQLMPAEGSTSARAIYGVQAADQSFAELFEIGEGAIASALSATEKRPRGSVQ